MSSSENDLIQEGLQLFLKGLHSSVPLRHFSQHRDETRIRKVARKESGKALKNFTKKVEASETDLTRIGALLNIFCLELKKLIEEYVIKNQAFKEESESFLQKMVEVCCEDFQSSINAKVVMNPEMDLKSVEDFFEAGKPKATDYFEHLWKHGNLGGFEEKKRQLEEKLNSLKNKIVEKQTRALEIKEEEDARRSLKEFQNIVLAVARQVIDDISALDGRIVNDILKEKAHGIHGTLVSKGKVVKEKYRELHMELLGLLEDSVKFLDDAVEDMSVEEAVDWAEKLKMKLHSSFDAKEKHETGPKVQQTGDELELTSNEIASTEIAQNESLEMECDVEPVNVNVNISPVTPIQIQPEINRDRNVDQIHAEMDEIRSNLNSDLAEVIDTGVEMRLKGSKQKGAPDGPCNEFNSEDMHQDASVEDELEREEMNVKLVTVTSVQPEALSNTADEELQIKVTCKTSEPETEENDGNVEVGRKRSHPETLDVTVAAVTSLASKRLKQESNLNLKLKEERPVTLTKDNNPLNVPDTKGYFPLLRAIMDGRNVDCIKKMLDDGADVNIKGIDSFDFNAAHSVINCLYYNRRCPKNALDILNLLVTKGFNLINDHSRKGFTPLHLAVQCENLNEDILSWFHNNGADFNAVLKHTSGNSVLFQAVGHGQGARIITKIIDLGGDPNHVNKWKRNALHMSARHANESALEIFIDKLDVNEVDNDGNTPLHLLFRVEGLELKYERCMEPLLKKGAKFDLKNVQGLVPLMSWIKLGQGNPFPTIIKMKDTLPITEEIASAALTVIVQEMEKKQKLLPSSSQSPSNEFVQFILFLIEGKKAKILWKDENQWKRNDWLKVDKGVFSRDFFKELKTTLRTNWTSKLVRVTSHSQTVGKLQLLTDANSVSVPMETIIACLLTCKNYQGFAELCRLVGKLCVRF